MQPISASGIRFITHHMWRTPAGVSWCLGSRGLQKSGCQPRLNSLSCHDICGTLSSKPKGTSTLEQYLILLFLVIICQIMDTYSIYTYKWKTVCVYLWVLFWSDKTLLIPSQTHVHVWPRLLRTRWTPMQQMSKNSRVDREDGLVFTHEPQTFILTNQACAVMLWGLKN